jgi:hypothetical protein
MDIALMELAGRSRSVDQPRVATGFCTTVLSVTGDFSGTFLAASWADRLTPAITAVATNANIIRILIFNIFNVSSS